MKMEEDFLGSNIFSVMKYMKVSIKYTNYVYLESNDLKFPKSGGTM